MTKFITATPKQAEVINTPEGITRTIVTLGSGQGASTTLLLKSLSHGDVSTIFNPTYKQAKQAFESAKHTLRDLGFRFSQHSMIVSHDKLDIKIKFSSAEDPMKTAGFSRDLMLFDNVHQCNKETVILHHGRCNEMLFTSNTLNSCLLIAEYVGDGFEEGYWDIDTEKSSWCHYLVDYNTLDKTQKLHTLLPDNFKGGVRVVMGGEV